MERREAAQAYLGGQLSRRVFLRRMVALGIALPAAVAYADLLMADPARAVAWDYYIGVYDFEFVPRRTVTSGIDTAVQFWVNSSATTWHNAKDPTGVIASGHMDPSTGYLYHAAYAGTFEYRCTDGSHDRMQGKIRVPMAGVPTSGPSGTTVDFAWSVIGGGDYHFDIQRKRPGSDVWKDWLVDTSTSRTSDTLTSVGTHLYRCRTINSLTGKKSGWSPTLSIEIA